MHVCDLTSNTSPPFGYWLADWSQTGNCDYNDPDEVLDLHRPVLRVSLRNLYEINYKQLAKAIDPTFLSQGIRARALRGVYYQGFFWPNTPGDRADARISDTMWFKVTSSLHQYNGLDYDCFVKFMDWDEVGADPDLTPREKALMLLWTGDLQLDCNDVSFRYWGYQYILTQLDAAIRPEDRYPKYRNPQLRGVVCKHLNRVLKALPFHNADISKELINQFGGEMDQQTTADMERTAQLQIAADQGMNAPPEVMQGAVSPVDWATQQQRIDLVKGEEPEEQPPDNAVEPDQGTAIRP